MRRLVLLFLVCVSYLASAEPVTHVYELENGLKLIVKEDRRAPVVVSQLWYKVGSSYETVGRTGIAHVLEHMMFKGTEAYPEDTFSQLISENGGEQNAFTYYDFTTYYQKLRASLLPLSFKLEADRMQNLNFDQAAFEKEANVVANERLLRTEDQPERLAEERFLATAYLGNPYQHPVIGWMADIKAIGIDDLRHWYQSWYAPNNAILVVVGDVKGTEVFELAKQYFAGIPKRQIPTIHQAAMLPPFGRRQLEVKLPTKVPQLFMGYNVPALNVGEQKEGEAYALEMLLHLLDGGKSARLEKELVRKQKVAAAIQTQYPLYALHPTLFQFEATPSADQDLASVENAILAEIEKIKNEPIASQEFERVKTKVIAQHLYAKDSMFYQAYMIGALEVLGVSYEESERYVEKIHAITPAQVQEVAKKYLTPERLTVTYLIPSQAEEGASS